MKIAGIIIIAFIGLVIIGKNGKTNSVKGLASIMDNANNHLGMTVGSPSDFQQSFESYRQLSQSELVDLLENESLNLYEASNALMILSNTYLAKGEVTEGLRYLEVAAEIYHNPLAQTILAKANYTGYHVEAKGASPGYVRDLARAYYLINRAFETAGKMHEFTGEKFALDRSVGMGLGVLDAYQTAEIKAQFNYLTDGEGVTKQVAADLDAWAEMYGI